MIEDRDYMREPSLGPRRPVTITLLVANAVLFLAQNLVYQAAPQFPLDDWFALSPAGLAHGFVWQLLTFQFMHSGLLHLLLNSWGIYVFGRAVEEILGTSRFIQLYLVSGSLGGLLQVVLSLALPGLFGAGAVVGASAGLFGLIGAFATLFPHQRLTLLLFFVLPVTLTARVLLIVSAMIAVLGLVIRGDNVAHAAHLGGMGAGLLYVRLVVFGQWRRSRPPLRRAAPRPFARVATRQVRSWTASPLPEAPESGTEDFVSREVDPILDKISAHGLQSLTERERRILEAARRKIGQR